MPITVPDRDDWFHDQHGFPQPNWGAVNGWMRVFVPHEDREDAWQQCTRHWLGRICHRLGHRYGTVESQNFHFVSDLSPAARGKVLAMLESSRTRICRVLGATAPSEANGKHVVLRFTLADDYYAYISHFLRDGEFAGSAGMFLSDGYDHIAYVESWSADEERRTLVHELAHNLFAHLPLPSWLNEALAMAFEADIAGTSAEPLSRELAARHRAYWTPSTIQEFWAGRAFSDVEAQELSYSLSRVLLHLIYTEVRPQEGEFSRFVLRSDWGDAGSIAAKEHLDIPLENLVSAFHGPGDWAPRPHSWQHERAADPPADRL